MLNCIAGVSYNTDEMSLREAFAQYGEVVDGTHFFFWTHSISTGFSLLLIEVTSNNLVVVQVNFSVLKCDVEATFFMSERFIKNGGEAPIYIFCVRQYILHFFFYFWFLSHVKFSLQLQFLAIKECFNCHQ